jgi:flagellar motor switch protein FliN/FliY
MTEEEKKDNGVTADMEAAWAEALNEQEVKSPLLQQSHDHAIEKAELEHFESTASAMNAGSASSDIVSENLEVVMDIPVTLSMEVGKAEISIRNLLKLNQGSVIELQRFAGDPLDVYVNGTLIAHGEVVVINEKFGIRLTDIISSTERLKKLE